MGGIDGWMNEWVCGCVSGYKDVHAATSTACKAQQGTVLFHAVIIACI